MWNNLVLLLSLTVIAQGQYVAEDDGGLMNHIPQYDNAGNLMGDYWWHPTFKLDQTPPPWQPWGKTEHTEFTDQKYNPEHMNIEDFEHSSLQTWPTPIVVGDPGHATQPGKKYDLKGRGAGTLMKPHQDVIGKLPGGQTPYPNYNVRMAAMPMHEDYLRIDPKLAAKPLTPEAAKAAQPPGTVAVGKNKDASPGGDIGSARGMAEGKNDDGDHGENHDDHGHVDKGGYGDHHDEHHDDHGHDEAHHDEQHDEGHHDEQHDDHGHDEGHHDEQHDDHGRDYDHGHVDKGGYGDHHDEHHDDHSSFLESAFYPRAPVHLASTIIARGQPVPTADLNGATHTVIHQSLQGINVGAAANPYAATQPSAVAFATNPLAYHPQAIVHHPSQIGAAAVAQTRTLQHAYGSYEGGNIAYHPVHAPLIGNQRAHAHYARTAFAPRPGDANYGYSPYYPHPGLHPLAGVAPYHHHALSHPAVVLPQAHPSGLVYPTKFIELSSKISAYHGKKPSAYHGKVANTEKVDGTKEK